MLNGHCRIYLIEPFFDDFIKNNVCPLFPSFMHNSHWTSSNIALHLLDVQLSRVTCPLNSIFIRGQCLDDALTIHVNTFMLIRMYFYQNALTFWTVHVSANFVDWKFPAEICISSSFSYLYSSTGFTCVVKSARIVWIVFVALEWVREKKSGFAFW